MSDNSRSAKRGLDRKQHRMNIANKRVAEWQALTPAEQLAALDRRLGVGQGATKQRARIATKIG